MDIIDTTSRNESYAQIHSGKVLTPAFEVDDLGAFYISDWFREELKEIFREVINEKKEN